MEGQRLRVQGGGIPDTVGWYVITSLTVGAAATTRSKAGIRPAGMIPITRVSRQLKSHAGSTQPPGPTPGIRMNGTNLMIRYFFYKRSDRSATALTVAG